MLLSIHGEREELARIRFFGTFPFQFHSLNYNHQITKIGYGVIVYLYKVYRTFVKGCEG